jgi:hypothetical protein
MNRLVLLAFLFAHTALARSDWMNPGNMGANAVPGFAIEEPWTEQYTLLQLGAAAQQGVRYDTSLFPQVRLVVPFGKWVSTYFEGGPVELWWSSPQTRAEWALTQTQGVSKADLRFGFKIMMADLGDGLPKLGFRALTKSTTGKGYSERRFTDGPAYLLEFLLGQRFQLKGFAFDLLGMGGYWIWQQGESGQNDAITWGLAVQSQFFQRLNLQLGLRGYAGWQKLDKPVLATAKVGVVITSWLELSLGFNYGFRDAARLEGLLSFNFRLPLLGPLVLDLAGASASASGASAK